MCSFVCVENNFSSHSSFSFYRVRNITVIAPDTTWKAAPDEADDIVLALIQNKHFHRAPKGIFILCSLLLHCCTEKFCFVYCPT